VGGHCLPVDPSYLSWRVRRSLGQTFRFVELANDVNAHMPHYVVKRLTEGLNRRSKPLNGSRILVLGIAYKPNTGDARESPGAVIVELLRAAGARVRVADPHVEARGATELVAASTEEIAAADAVVLITDHDEFDLPTVVRHAAYLLDTRGRASGPNVEQL
jgi:UDP-N-acetyl-D-glucosamine dehydrogenase